jgi:hypothetical protein
MPKNYGGAIEVYGDWGKLIGRIRIDKSVKIQDVYHTVYDLLDGWHCIQEDLSENYDE